MLLFRCISLIGEVNGQNAPGLENIFNYMNENLFCKDGPTISEHHYHITKHNITQKHLSYTKYINPKHVILKQFIYR